MSHSSFLSFIFSSLQSLSDDVWRCWFSLNVLKVTKDMEQQALIFYLVKRLLKFLLVILCEYALVHTFNSWTLAEILAQCRCTQEKMGHAQMFKVVCLLTCTYTNDETACPHIGATVQWTTRPHTSGTHGCDRYRLHSQFLSFGTNLYICYVVKVTCNFAGLSYGVDKLHRIAKD